MLLGARVVEDVRDALEHLARLLRDLRAARARARVRRSDRASPARARRRRPGPAMPSSTKMPRRRAGRTRRASPESSASVDALLARARRGVAANSGVEHAIQLGRDRAGSARRRSRRGAGRTDRPSRVGSRPTAKQPTSVSMRSAIATSAPSSVVGQRGALPLRPAVLLDRDRRPRRPSPTMPRVVLAHHALQLGELADRAATRDRPCTGARRVRATSRSHATRSASAATIASMRRTLSPIVFALSPSLAWNTTPSSFSFHCVERLLAVLGEEELARRTAATRAPSRCRARRPSDP